MKITIGEWNRFMQDWVELDKKDEWYYDDQEVPFEERGDLRDPSIQSVKFDITGYVAHRTCSRWEEVPPLGFLGKWNLDIAIRKWRRSCKFTTMVITVPNERLDEVKSIIKGLGGKFTA